MERDKVHESMRLFATEVMPAVAEMERARGLDAGNDTHDAGLSDWINERPVAGQALAQAPRRHRQAARLRAARRERLR